MKKLITFLIVSLLMLTMVVGCTPTPAEEAAADVETPSEDVAEETPEEETEAEEPAAETEKSNLELSLEGDALVGDLKALDNQPLVYEGFVKEFPVRPDDPDSLPETDAGHYYDLEFAGWSQEKTNIPESPADGSIGKKVTMIIHGEHAYYSAYVRGCQTIADIYGIEFNVLWPNWDLTTQNQMIDQAINDKPDMIILLPLDTEAGLIQCKKINEAGIPLIVAHQLVVEEALQYAVCWTGPDEWAPRRVLAEMIAEETGGTGGYAILTHNAGGSTYFSRAYGYITKLAEIAPDMELLDLQAPGLDAAAAKQVADDWIKLYGDDLKVIITAGVSNQGVGAVEAVAAAGKEDDILIYGAGNSKIGNDMVKDGSTVAMNYEPPEACGATALKTAADWFNGKVIPSAVYLPAVVITLDNVDDFYPAQW